MCVFSNVKQTAQRHRTDLTHVPQATSSFPLYKTEGVEVGPVYGGQPESTTVTTNNHNTTTTTYTQSTEYNSHTSNTTTTTAHMLQAYPARQIPRNQSASKTHLPRTVTHCHAPCT
jgi:hypothetical protein